MIGRLYSNAFSALKRSFFPIWGVSLFAELLILIGSLLFGIIPGAALAIAILLGSAMSLAFLRVYRGERPHCIQLFDTCRDWHTVKRMLAGMGWMTLWIFIWSLIPIVGIIFAVIRGYEYSLTPYILANEPDVSPTHAIKVSSSKTKGYKARMFGADMLCVGVFIAAMLIIWLICVLPGILGFYRTSARLLPAATALTVIIEVIYILVAPMLLGLIHGGFYDEISNRALCPKCGTPIAPDAVFCSSCGANLSHAQPEVGGTNDGAELRVEDDCRFCPRCGAELEDGCIFCTECGFKVDG